MKTNTLYIVQFYNDTMHYPAWHDDYDSTDLDDVSEYIEEQRKEERSHRAGYKYRLIKREYKDKILKIKKQNP